MGGSRWKEVGGFACLLLLGRKGGVGGEGRALTQRKKGSNYES